MSVEALYHRLGAVLEITSTSEQRNPAGRTRRYAHCRVKWDDNGETGSLDLAEGYAPGDRTAIICRGGNYICDVNLGTGEQSAIGDRVEGVAALIMLISIPLCLVIVGIPIYWSVALYSKVTTTSLRKQVAAYVGDLLRPLQPSGLGRATA
ncbi:MAG: hypothetical protein SGJ21_02895 [Alphaproteobacteria bacterium]|nr:hypothetical protein [Alphaproteobacteria bacterium]